MEIHHLLDQTRDFLKRLHLLKKNDIAPLRTIICEHNKLYYTQENPIISDEEYDTLFHALARLESDFSMLDADSPTAKLSILMSEQFQKVRHTYPMISLENTYSIRDIREWQDRICRILEKVGKNGEDISYYIQPKYDGLGIALIYKYGKLTQALTRGSGIEGEDVTLGAREITNIPQNITALDTVPSIEIRGEVVMNRDVFDRVNHERMNMGERLFANPRNAASGSLRQLDPLVTRSRQLQFFAYSIPQEEITSAYTTYAELLKQLQVWGFAHQDFSFAHIQGIQALEHCIQQETQSFLSPQYQEYFNFDIDGMVIKLNNLELWHILGNTEHHPRYAIAYKFPAKQVRTRVLSIEHSVGRTGTVTPVANLEAVNVGGAIVRRATLHNYDELAKKDVREGDYVFIVRAGEVIPDIVSVLPELRTGGEKIVTLPEVCPRCQTPLVRDAGKVALVCPSIHCPAQVQGQFEMFVSKHALNIDGFGERQIALFLKKGWLSDFTSIFYLHQYQNELLQTEGFQKKSIENLLHAINTARNTTYDRLFVALGIPLVGRKTSKIFVNKIQECMLKEQAHQNFLDAGFQKELFLQCAEIVASADVGEMRDIGPETAGSFFLYISENSGKIRELLMELSFPLVIPGEKTMQQSPIVGKTFCVTGSFSLDRDAIHEKIEQYGGMVRTSVSSQLDYLICGEKAGSKQKKAEQLGISCISWETFTALLDA